MKSESTSKDMSSDDGGGAEAVIEAGLERLAGVRSEPRRISRVALANVTAELSSRMSEAKRQASLLPITQDQVLPDELEAILARLVRARMEAWAATEELVAAALDEQESAGNEVAEHLGDFEDALDGFDRALFDRCDILARLATTGELTRWRCTLADSYRQPLPWWLDGRLEARASRIAGEVRRELLRTASLGRAAVLPEPRIGHPLADVRSVFVLEHAAAAAAADARLGHAVSWQSPAGTMVAVLIPPPARSAAPEKLVIEFVTESDCPAVDMAGKVAFLAGGTAVIRQLSTDLDSAVVAEFPGELLQHAGATGVLSLEVAGEGVWDPVIGRNH